MKKIYVFLFPLLMGILSTFAQAVDDVEGAMLKLNEERAHLQQQLREHPEQAKDILSKFLDLGLWKEAEKEIHEQSKLTSQERILLQVKYLLLNNDFHKAEEWVDRLLEENPGHAEALRYRAVLLIEAWKLKDAELLSKELLTSNPHDQEAASVLGRSLLLQKKYPEALRLAKNLQKNYPQSASGYLLEADVYFWDQHPEKAEAPLVHALSLNPFHADARFSYGYAIWRRVDATQLNDMAAQWELALAINPLHFSTHWHWGNGHTNLTFADYADPNEKEIREQLKAADSLFSRQELGAAIQKIHAVAKQFPQSVLPAMHEASLLYSDFESKNRWEELKQSESLFREVLERKAHYGPAHNGLAAVIKSKRIAYLANFDSLNRVFDRLEINDPVNFSKVFPDMDYYPGNRVKAMVWNQLFTSVVYFPFLSKQENAFVIPLCILIWPWP